MKLNDYKFKLFKTTNEELMNILALITIQDNNNKSLLKHILNKYIIQNKKKPIDFSAEYQNTLTEYEIQKKELIKLFGIVEKTPTTPSVINEAEESDEDSNVESKKDSNIESDEALEKEPKINTVPTATEESSDIFNSLWTIPPPVGRAHPRRIAVLKGISSGFLTNRFSETIE